LVAFCAALVALAALAGCGSSGGGQEAAAQESRGNESSAGEARGEASREAAGYDAATRGDEEFNRTFRHGFAAVDDVTMHYVIGGEGPPLVLLHGWPQTWYEFEGIMPALAEEHTVIAVDLPGLGDSVGSPPDYEKATLARYVHGLVADELGYDEVGLAAHDLGAGVGYQYAVQYPEEVRRFAFMDFFLPGPGAEVAQLEGGYWHFALHRQEEVPEMLTQGREREYLEHFYPEVAGSPDAISEEQVNEFARTYSQPEKMSGGFELYRTLDEDAEANMAGEEAPLEMPVMAMSASTWPEGAVADTIRPVGRDVEAVTVPDSGHWLSEENPEFVTEELLRFFGEGSDEGS
jgi:pimeloyl-ACP methyl ester carboxylesterase